MTSKQGAMHSPITGGSEMFEPDPNHGWVDYQSEAEARVKGLLASANGQTYIGADHINHAKEKGRESVRITSKKKYSSGSLIILDLAHMPGGICGTWPAFWTESTIRWPNGGEIDIVDGIHDQQTNWNTLHTPPGCTIANAGFSGTLRTSNCDVNAAGQGQNEGCTIVSQDANSYGPVFNANGGGVFATEFSEVAIRMWFWPRSHVLLDIMAGIPEPAHWGVPVSSFGGRCDIKRFFAPQQIVLNLNFCGDWAGYFWKGACAEKAMTCREYVADHPEAFREAYWSIYPLRVYTIKGEEEDPERRGSERTAITVPIPEPLVEATVTSQFRQTLSEFVRSFGAMRNGPVSRHSP